MNTKQIAEELAEKWHFCAELEADVTAAIEKATEITDAANASLLALAAVVRGHPNTPESLKTIASKELLDSNRGSYLVNELQRLRKALRAAHASESISEKAKRKGWTKPVNSIGQRILPDKPAHASEEYKHDVRESHGAQ